MIVCLFLSSSGRIHRAMMMGFELLKVRSYFTHLAAMEDLILSPNESQRDVSKLQQPHKKNSVDVSSLQQALASLKNSEETSSVKDLIILMDKCRRVKWPAYAKHLHKHICDHNLETHPEVGNYLIPMLVECGSLPEARRVFDALILRNEHSWTFLILGYVEFGEPQSALELYETMQEESVCPNRYALQLLVKACAKIECVKTGRRIHAEIAKLAVEQNRFVASALIDMYARCGFLGEAQDICNKFQVPDTVSWTALISGYAEHGPFEEALICLEQMKLKGISPDAFTYVCSLKACSMIGVLNTGQALHLEVAKLGFEKNPFIGSVLVNFYVKCSCMAEAQLIFDGLPVRDVVLWNVLIAGYAENDQAEEAFDCFKKMQYMGVAPTSVTFINSLKGCDSLHALDRGHQIHIEIAKEEFETNPLIGSALVDMYIKCGSLTEAREVFDELQNKSVVTWTALVAGYAEHGQGEEALNCFDQMQAEGISPNDVTCLCCLKACSSVGMLDKGYIVHALVAQEGWETDRCVGNTLVDMYAKCGSILEAREVFHELPNQDIVSWNALISKHVEHGLDEEALTSFEQMQMSACVCPDVVTYMSCLKACSNLGTIEKGRKLHAEVSKVGFESDSFLGSTLVDMYGKCGSLAEAQEVFDGLLVQDVVPWNALLAGYAFQGEHDVFFSLLEKMRGEGIYPDATTFLRVLNLCSHAGYVGDGQKYFALFRDNHGLSPAVEHYNAIVDLLGRAGQLNEAVIMLERMPFQPDPVTWTTVLAACRKWGNVDLARRAFQCAFKLEKQAATFISMTNIYADAHMWEDAKMVDALRTNLPALFEPGISLAEISACMDSS